MMKFYKHAFLAALPYILVFGLFSLFVFYGNGNVSADSIGNAKAGLNQTCAGGSCSGGQSTIATFAKAVVNIISLIAGIIAVIMIIISGVKFLASGGDSQAVSSAKNTLIYAIIGIVIVAASQVIVHFVLNAASYGTVNAN